MTSKNQTSGVKTPTKPWGLYIFLFIVFFGITITYLAMGNFIQSKGEKVQQLKAQVSQAEAEYGKLRLKEANLSTPQRIEYIATSTLGMVVAGEESTVFYIASEKGGASENN